MMMRFALAGLLTAASVLVSGCASTSGGADDRTAQAVSAVELDAASLPWMSRSEDFTSLPQLAKTSDVIALVKVRPGGPMHELGDEMFPLMDVTVDVLAPLKGTATVGDQLSVVSEAAINEESGELSTRKLVAEDRYILFLRQLESVPSSFAITGYLSGIYREALPGVFGRVDPESPELPTSVTLDEVLRTLTTR